MGKKPKRQDLIASKQILKKWYLNARTRNKTSAMEETKKIYEMLEYFESVTDWNKFEP